MVDCPSELNMILELHYISKWFGLTKLMFSLSLTLTSEEQMNLKKRYVEGCLQNFSMTVFGTDVTSVYRFFQSKAVLIKVQWTWFEVQSRSNYIWWNDYLHKRTAQT